MMKKNLILIALLLGLSFPLVAQIEEAPSKVKWYTLEQAEKLAKKEPRPIMIDVFTDWCGWCKVFMKTTFAHPQISEYLNTHFYPVRLDAEGHDTITFKGKKYVNKSKAKGSKHELASEFEVSSYPTLIFIAKNGQKAVLPGYLDVASFEPIMYYFAEEFSQMLPYDKYESLFRTTFSNPKDTTYRDKTKSIDTTGTVRLYSFDEMQELQKKSPRKVLIHIDVPWNVAGKMMVKTTYKNPIIAKYLNEKFYVVYFNATSKNPITVFGENYVNEQKEHPYHNLAVAMLQGKMEFPATLFLNEKGQLINRMQTYLSPEMTEPILHYFGENEYLTKTWEEYQKKFKGTFR